MFNSLLSSNKSLALMLIKTQKNVFSNISGESTSKKNGSGYDFSELREYEIGDDIRHIDWIISSKMGKPHIKIFKQEKELNVVLAPIMSSSLNFGVKVLKHSLLNEIAALISLSCVKHNNPFESYICNDDVVINTQKSKQLFAVRNLVENLSSYSLLGKNVNFKLISSKLYANIKNKSLLFLIGDFFDAKEFDFNVLSIKHELVVIIIRDKFEENPILLGDIHVTDPGSLKSSFVTIDKKSAKLIRQKVLQEDAILFERLKKLGIKFVKVYTDENPVNKILPLMNQA